MYVKVVLHEDTLPNRLYGPYARVAHSEPMKVEPERVETDGLVIRVCPSDENIIVRGVRQRYKEGGVLAVEEVFIIGTDRADIYLLNDEGRTLEVIWRARWRR